MIIQQSDLMKSSLDFEDDSTNSDSDKLQTSLQIQNEDYGFWTAALFMASMKTWNGCSVQSLVQCSNHQLTLFLD